MRLPQKVSRKHVVTGLLLLSLISSLAEPKGISFLRNLAHPLLAPLSHSMLYLSDRVAGNFKDLTASATDPAEIRRLRDENQALQNAAASYEQQIADLSRQASDVSAWHSALDRDFPCGLIHATIIAENTSPYAATRVLRTPRKVDKNAPVTTCGLTINRPTAIPSDLAVLSSTALIGRVISSSAWTAELQLLTDPDFQAEAFVKRLVDPNQPRMIETDAHVSRPLRQDDPMIAINLRGQGGDHLTTAELPAYHNVGPGDYVVSMGNDGRLPLGVMIGRVIAAIPVPNNPTHVRLEIAPAADLANCSDVYVVVPKGGGGR